VHDADQDRPEDDPLPQGSAADVPRGKDGSATHRKLLRAGGYIGTVVISIVVGLVVAGFSPTVGEWVHGIVHGCGATRLVITYPSDGASIDTPVELKGTNACVPSGSEAWIFVKGPDELYHPQRLPILMLPDNRWTAQAWVGLESDHGVSFEVSVWLVGEAGEISLHQYVNKASTNGNWYGLRKAPKGSIMYDSVEVTRK